jgi:hypothetical protein
MFPDCEWFSSPSFYFVEGKKMAVRLGFLTCEITQACSLSSNNPVLIAVLTEQN